jgi:DNA-binding HxlR family transcriptional regulator
MADRRSYHQFCGLARALDLVGERWTLLIVRNLLLGPKRYSDLLRGLPGITTNLLAKRLREMQELGLVERSADPSRAERYELTELGRALEPPVMELARWGSRFLVDGPASDDVLDIGWGLLSLKRRYVGGMRAVIELRVDERVFELALEPDYVHVTEGAAARPDATVAGSSAAFRALFFGGAERTRDTGELVEAGEQPGLELLRRAFALAGDAAR